ncbi:ABC transporter substrate-binding protein [Stackebrandtia soli]|uniref:ABC transporter substrate-binding protein n=1 Tax=Stackebrandtia soli TaxID=1892856 RepID=UPI0039E9FD58
MKRLSALTAVVVAALALTACGTTEDPNGDKNSGGDPITVTDARGEKVTLDGPAKKVGGTEWNVIEHLVSLGVQPTAVSDVEGFNTWDSAVTLDPKATDIGTRGEPNLDTLLDLELDVLFVTDSLVDGAIEQIEKHTPVIVVPGGDSSDPIGQMWKNIDLVAKATGTEDKAAELKTAFDEKLAATAEAVAASEYADASVAFSDSYNTGEAIVVRAFTGGSLIGGVFAELGFANAWDTIDSLEGDTAYGLAPTDVEGLTKLPEDTIYWYIGGAGEPDVYTEDLADNPIWTGLPFVENDDVHRFPDKIWMFGGSASMTQLLDAVTAAIA